MSLSAADTLRNIVIIVDRRLLVCAVGVNNLVDLETLQIGKLGPRAEAVQWGSALAAVPACTMQACVCVCMFTLLTNTVLVNFYYILIVFAR